MKLLFLIGNAAAGKMTVGQELMKITGLRLFHNHMTIEPVIEILGYYDGKTINRLREVIFEEFAASANYGMIFTYMWAFDRQEDWDYIEHVKDIFRQKNKDTEFYHVELVAPQEIRLKRNVTENRLKNKASKNNIEASNRNLIEADKKYRLESFDGEIPFENYIKIDNSELAPEDAAKKIRDYFDL
ncbi:MAG: shikimate kinase [Lachnospiraceae bacterium]|nr:shikimate kinase [Lachnospiraceae bacterium]